MTTTGDTEDYQAMHADLREQAFGTGGLMGQRDEARAEVRALRRLLWLHHGHDGPAIYGDDGEMQCHACPLDFRRAGIEQIAQRFWQRNSGIEADVSIDQLVQRFLH